MQLAINERHKRVKDAFIAFPPGLGSCGSYSPQLTLVLDEKPVEKHGSEVAYRSVVMAASAAIRFRSLLIS
jgi:hypothetical protein